MSTNGILDFQNTNKIIFRGSDSNVVIDTSNVSLGIGIQGTETPGSNLHVVGDAYISSNLKLTTDTSILVNSNVVTNFSGPHARLPKEVPLKKYPEIIFESGKFDTNSTNKVNIQGGYTVEVSSLYDTDYQPGRLFNDVYLPIGSTSTAEVYGWHSSANQYGSDGTYSGGLSALDGTTTGEWITLKLPNKIKLSSIRMIPRNHANKHRMPYEGKILGWNGSSWDVIHSYTGLLWASQEWKSITTDTTNYYDYIGIIIHKLDPTTSGNNTVNIGELELYGYEEDPPAGDTSVDTTFTSIINTPQTTGANVYVDAKLSSDFTNQVTGPTPVGTAAVHDNTNKYWELNGQLTSNITMEANTFLEGDQPHAVSVWFNSSNLEANVSNTCVFSVSDQEKLDSVNLDLQSNTWHNLTYAYQGEGGSRVTYLDGRKVAEDQAEDTFGEYPPFAMTGYSQGGYVVSASSESSNANHKAYDAFDKLSGNSTESWHTQDHGYINGSDATRSTFPTWSGSTNHNGEWLKLEIPHKIILNYINITGRSTHLYQRPRQFTIVGSNDDVNWETLYQEISRSGTSSTIPTDDTHVMSGLSVGKSFKYFAIIIKNTATDNPHNHTSIGEMKLYGHRENDLVRLPDPTNVLKYPHVAMTGPAQRGYVASASSSWPLDSIQPEHGFNGVLTSGSLGHTWESGPLGNSTTTGAGRYTGGSTFNTAYLSNTPLYGEGGFQTTESSNTWTGEWLQIQLPHSINTTKCVFGNAVGNSGWNDRIPTSGVILGSTKGSTWNLVHQFSSTLIDQTLTISHTGYYKYFRLVGTTVGGSQTIMLIPEWELYGTGVDSIPLRIGGGNIDKVANFRVYDKFVGEDQALEIWDAQKDEFGRAKSSMTLHKGRLGIGTTEPEGRLAVLDEPHNLEEFPPRAMTGYKTYFEGHGEFCVSASDEFDTAGSYSPWKAFSKSTGALSFFITDHSPATYNTDGTPTAAAGTFEGVSGSWLKLKLPYDILLKSINLARRSDAAEHFSTALLYGSVDDVSWDVLHNIQMPTAYTNVDFEINATKVYKYFVIQITRGAGVTYQNIGEWKLFGTREQGQSVLHDGQLTLTKSLNVPRIGPALDADDTPRRDRLVVEYNTSTNPTFEGAVRDTSGRGNDGFAPNVSYLNKSLWFPGNGKINGKHTLGEGTGITLTISLWFKLNSTGNQRIVIIGDQNTQYKSINVTYFSNRIGLDYWLSEVQTPAGSVSTGQWYHMVIVHKGPGTTATGSQDIYLNNVKQTLNLHASNNSNSTFDLLGDGLVLGSDAGAGGTYLSGYISQFKLYDTALTAEEVKTLYDMGRMGSVANPQPLHIAAPLYSPGTIVQVESATMIDTWSSSLASSAAVAATTFLDVEGMSVNIHPKFSNSKFLISYHANIGGNNGHVALRLKRTRNGVETYLAQPTAGQNRMKGTAYLHSRQTTLHCFSLEHLDNPGNDTGDITYQLVAYSKRGDAYYIHLNKSHTDTNNEYYGRSSSTITVKEICQ